MVDRGNEPKNEERKERRDEKLGAEMLLIWGNLVNFARFSR